MARERGYTVDTAGFERALDVQRTQSKDERRGRRIGVTADDLDPCATCPRAAWFGLLPRQSAPPRALDVLARRVQPGSNAGRELHLPSAIRQDARAGEADDQPTPGCGVKSVEHLNWASPDQGAKTDELLGGWLAGRIKERVFARCRRGFPLSHARATFSRVPAGTRWGRVSERAGP